MARSSVQNLVWRRYKADTFQGQLLSSPLATLFRAAFASRLFHQNSTHRLGRSSKEMPPAIPVLGFFDVDEPDISVMHERLACNVCPGFS